MQEVLSFLTLTAVAYVLFKSLQPIAKELHITENSFRGPAYASDNQRDIPVSDVLVATPVGDDVYDVRTSGNDMRRMTGAALKKYVDDPRYNVIQTNPRQ